MPIKPDFDWYSAKSASAKLPPRCPIASSELCPRYYSSRWLLGNAEVSTKISDEDKARLDKKWRPFQPSTAEEEPSTLKTDDRLNSVSEFCPEVSYERFGLFAAGLYRYADEIDSNHAHEQLGKSGAGAGDPRWQWAGVTPRHYTECREYSLFSEASSPVPRGLRSRARRNEVTPRIRWQVLARDSFTCQYCGRRPPDAVLEVDHRTSVSNGGSNEPENLVAACQDCNRGKGSDSTSGRSPSASET